MNFVMKKLGEFHEDQELTICNGIVGLHRLQFRFYCDFWRKKWCPRGFDLTCRLFVLENRKLGC